MIYTLRNLNLFVRF